MRRAKQAPGAWAFHWPYELIECDTTGAPRVAATHGQHLHDHGVQSHEALHDNLEETALHRVVAYPKAEHAAWQHESLSFAARHGHGGAPPPRNVEDWNLHAAG